MVHLSRENVRPAWVLVLASLASFIVSLDALVVTTALTTIRRNPGVPIEALEWTVNAYTLSFAVLLIPAAALDDRFGRRRGLQAIEHLDSVAVTFALAWAQVHRLSPAAAELLRLCAFLLRTLSPRNSLPSRRHGCHPCCGKR